MLRTRRWPALGVAVALVAAATVVVASGASGGGKAAAKPIIIGAAVDLTGQMAPFDAPALAAARIEVAKLNARGGAGGRKFQIRVCDHQGKNQKQCAAQLISQGAAIGLVTCDVEIAAPAVQEFINKGLLTVAPCISTDEMGPKRFGAKGRLAFTLGSLAQDEGAAMAEEAYARGWRRAIIVKDNLLVYFRDVSDSFAARFQELGGQIVQREAFTSFDKTINNVIGRVAPTKADVIAFVTAFGELPQFVAGLRSLGNNTPIFNSWGGDGTYWNPKDPQVTNYYYVTYASAFGDDPDPAVRRLVNQMKAAGAAPATGGFVLGAATIDAIAAAVSANGGATNGARLAASFEKFRNLITISGKINYTKQLHGVFGRAFRVMVINNNTPKFLRLHTTKKMARIR
jgi:branched-chain amino acid transport system substrate-binding protein